jgi:hypothetical protein
MQNNFLINENNDRLGNTYFEATIFNFLGSFGNTFH